MLAVTDAIFDRASLLWEYARQHGHPCGDADSLIAATALEHGLDWVTGNARDFAWVPGLRLQDWRVP